MPRHPNLWLVRGTQTCPLKCLHRTCCPAHNVVLMTNAQEPAPDELGRETEALQTPTDDGKIGRRGLLGLAWLDGAAGLVVALWLVWQIGRASCRERVCMSV